MPDLGAARTPSYAELFRSVMARREREIHTAIPGEVQSYDKDNQTADVQPLIQALTPAEGGALEVETLPVLTAVPVTFPAGGGMRLVLPIKKGDVGLIVFSEASLDAWQASGGLTNPGDQRRFHLSDAVFYPGLHDDKHPLTVESGDDASFGKDGAHQVVITPDEIELGGNSNSRPSDYVALASPTKSELGKLHDTLRDLVNTVKQNNALQKVNNNLISSHVHVVSGTAAAASPALAAMQSPSDPSGPQDVGDVKSSIVKSK